MSETKLKLIKNQKKQPHASERSLPVGRITSLPSLTLAERTEAARFRALTAAKAARQAMVHQIMAELQELDETESAA